MDTKVEIPDAVPPRMAFDAWFDELVAARWARDDARRRGAPVPELAAARARLDRARLQVASARRRWLGTG